MNQAELHSAFVWDCDNCGVENFCRAIEGWLDEPTAELLMQDDETAEQINPHYVTDAGSVGEDMVEAPYLIRRVCVTPKTVKCRECGTEYEGELFVPDEEE